MFGLTLFSPSPVATSHGGSITSVSTLPGALAAQVALAAKTPEAVIVEAQAIMAMPEPDQQQACLVAMGLDEDRAGELLDTVAELQERGIDLAEYPNLSNVIDEMFHRLDIYAKIAKHGKDVNSEFLVEVSTNLTSETIEGVQDELVELRQLISKE